jgi:hypothetical protein
MLAWCAAVVLGLFLVLVVWIYAYQWIFRLRAERLVKDYQSIRLHQTTWADAQVLMRRWGAWGHYDGTCTEANCRYSIVLLDLNPSYAPGQEIPRFYEFLFHPFVMRSIELLGGRFGWIEVGFIVQDGTIWRTKSNLGVHIPHTHFFAKPDDPGDVDGDLLLQADGRQSLRESIKGVHSILGNKEQIAEHPTYIVGRPGGCESCLEARVTYSPQITRDDIIRFSNYNFECFTSKVCQILEDILPAARDWHLYGSPWGFAETRPAIAPGPPVPCRTPVWALGRDATAVVGLDVVSTSQTKRRDWDGREVIYEKDSVRLDETLKSSAPWPLGTLLSVVPYDGEFRNPPFEAAERLEAKKRFLAIMYYGFPSQTKPLPPEVEREGPGFRLERCGVLDDTPANRAELAKGFALNDHLRVPEF